MENNRTEQMKKIKDEIVAAKDSPLYNFRIKNKYFPVIGEGSHNAKIMFIGEAPGRSEAETGRPFCGAAGKILDELLASIGVDRKEVYITNIIKDRPPMNRDPLPNEIEFYAPFLDRQIEIIKPKVIATLGRFSMTYIMKKFQPSADQPLAGGGSISVLHGKIFSADTSCGSIKIIPLYHPAVAIYNASEKETLKKDFLALTTFSHS